MATYTRPKFDKGITYKERLKDAVKRGMLEKDDALIPTAGGVDRYFKTSSRPSARDRGNTSND